MNLLHPQRVVLFEGMTLVVPHDTEFLTVDCNGFIQAHGSLPWMEVTFWEGNDELGVVGVVTEEEGADWMYRRDPVFVGADGYVV